VTAVLTFLIPRRQDGSVNPSHHDTDAFAGSYAGPCGIGESGNNKHMQKNETPCKADRYLRNVHFFRVSITPVRRVLITIVADTVSSTIASAARRSIAVLSALHFVCVHVRFWFMYNPGPDLSVFFFFVSFYLSPTIDCISRCLSMLFFQNDDHSFRYGTRWFAACKFNTSLIRNYPTKNFSLAYFMIVIKFSIPLFAVLTRCLDVVTPARPLLQFSNSTASVCIMRFCSSNFFSSICRLIW